MRILHCVIELNETIDVTFNDDIQRYFLNVDVVTRILAELGTGAYNVTVLLRMNDDTCRTGAICQKIREDDLYLELEPLRIPDTAFILQNVEETPPDHFAVID